jgi:endoglucanase
MHKLLIATLFCVGCGGAAPSSVLDGGGTTNGDLDVVDTTESPDGSHNNNDKADSGGGHHDGGTNVPGDMATDPPIKGSSSFAIAVSGNHLVDAKGNTVQLHGVNVSGLEGYAVQGWSPQDPWGGLAPNFTAIKSWGVNAIRVPLNEASWNGGTCIDEGGFGSTVVNGNKVDNKPGQKINPDPGGNYRATVEKVVTDAAANGMYVSLDLHFAAPGDGCPETQNPMADMDHSVVFWTSIANTFKQSPHVMFELFNEPFMDQYQLTDNSDPKADLENGGGTMPSWITFGNPGTVTESWKNAGFQAMLNAIRGTGATNVILTSTNSFSTMTGDWLKYHPTDTLKTSQVAAVWHVYPNSDGSSLVNCVGDPSTCSPATKASAQAILKAGYPVVITEFGDGYGQSQLSSMILPFADTNGMSYFAWTWDPWGQQDFVLIQDSNGTPTPGFGEYVKAHYLCRQAGTANCK